MTKRKTKPRPATAAEIAQAVKALGITVPIRAAEREGAQIVLYTRNGDFSWEPPPRRLRTVGPGSQGRAKSGAGGKVSPAKGAIK